MPITEYMSVIAKEERLRELFRELESVIVATQAASTAATSLTSRMKNSDRAQFALPDSRRVCLVSKRRNRSLSRSSVLITRSLAPMSWRIRNIAPTTATVVTFAKTSCTASSNPLRAVAASTHIVDSSTIDDLDDYRPGRCGGKATCRAQPADRSRLNKNEVRELSRRATLPTWDKPASPCLSSRIAYGTTVTIERLNESGPWRRDPKRVRISRVQSSSSRHPCPSGDLHRRDGPCAAERCGRSTGSAVSRAWFQVRHSRPAWISQWFYERSLTSQYRSPLIKLIAQAKRLRGS